ncbi:SPARC-related modular calcium-binding protein 1-like isoform X3 [Tachypleus tridentatus]|uniref:SPARC-related modular calcium-binding protein 1-like isoform X3 n=1 Tax=Tachypleus tridentatus TaxID=6853 RepID=UPI003FD420AC
MTLTFGSLVFIVLIFQLCQVWAQFLLLSSDNKKKCDIDCSKVNLVLVCATDGRTYQSICEIERAKCEGHPIELKHHGKCPASARCLAQRDIAEFQSKQDQSAVFKPQCKEDGSFMEVQCHQLSGYCWCVDDQGKPLPGSSVQYGHPKCNSLGRRTNRRRAFQRGRQRRVCSNTDRTTFNNNLVNIFKSEYKRLPSSLDVDSEDKQVIQWKFQQLDTNGDNILRRKEVRDLRRMAKKIIEPRPCAKTFTRHCDFDHDNTISMTEWTSCLMMDISLSFQLFMSLNSDEQGEASTEEGHTTIQELNEKMTVTKLSDNREHQPWKELEFPIVQTEIKAAEPNPKEEVEEVQDCLTTRRRAQKNPDNNLYIPSCKKRNGLYKDIQCFKPKNKPATCWCVRPKNGKPIPRTTSHGGRPPCRKMRKMAKMFKGCRIRKKQKFLSEFLDFITQEMLDSARNMSLSTIVKPTTEQATRWKFNQLDVDNNQLIDRAGPEEKLFQQQWRPFREPHRGRKRLKKCWRNFLRFCDKLGNNDETISITEWLKCTEVTQGSPKRPVIQSHIGHW